MDNPAQPLWDCLHQGTPLIRPVEVVGARRHSIGHHGDDEYVPPDPDLVLEKYVHYSKRRQHWYVQIRDWRSPVKKLHNKTGFNTQTEAMTYRDNKLAEWGNPLPPNNR